jgi:hypothetical protein
MKVRTASRKPFFVLECKGWPNQPGGKQAIRSALQANWQKPLFGSQCKSNELATKLE